MLDGAAEQVGLHERFFYILLDLVEVGQQLLRLLVLALESPLLQVVELAVPNLVEDVHLGGQQNRHESSLLLRAGDEVADLGDLVFEFIPPLSVLQERQQLLARLGLLLKLHRQPDVVQRAKVITVNM